METKDSQIIVIEELLGKKARPGREILRDLLQEELLRRRKKWTIPSVIRIWNICRRGSVFTLDGKIYKAPKLGWRKALKVWMETIVVRYYANNINALVYGGAMVLLVFVGLRFAGAITEETALIGIGVEVCMLCLLAILMFYTPEKDEDELLSDPLKNLQDTVSDLASVVSKMQSNLDPTQENKIREIIRSELFELIGRGIERSSNKLDLSSSKSNSPSK